MTDDLRKPTDQEQAVIAATYEAMTRLHDRMPKAEIEAVGMGKALIEDERGRWSTLLGKPVLELPGDTNRLALIVKIDPGVND